MTSHFARRLRLAATSAALTAVTVGCTLVSSTRFRPDLETAVQNFDVEKIEALYVAGARPVDAPALISLALAEAASRPEGCTSPQVGPFLTATIKKLHAHGWGLEENPKSLPGIRKDLSLAIDVLCPAEAVAFIAQNLQHGDATRGSFVVLEVAGRLQARAQAGTLKPEQLSALTALTETLRVYHTGYCTAADHARTLPPPSCRVLDSLQADPNLKALGAKQS